MLITGIFWKSKNSKFWLIEIPALDLMTQAKNEAEIPEMVKDAISLLADCEQSEIQVTIEANTLNVFGADQILNELAKTRQSNLDSGFGSTDVDAQNVYAMKR